MSGKLIAAALLAVAGTCVPAASQEAALPEEVFTRPFSPGTPAEVPVRVREIAPDFFLLIGRGGNSLAVRTADGLILVDTKLMYSAAYAELMSAAAGRSGLAKPVLTFITHHHADHSGGNAFVLRDGSRLVAHQNVPAILEGYVSRIAPVNPAQPSETFSSIFSDELGGHRVVARYWGPAHTTGDIAIHFPDAGVLAVGDMIYGNGELAVDYVDGQGSLLGMLDRVSDILALDFKILVPGHGDTSLTREEVVIYRDRLARFVNRGKDAVRRGVGVAELRDAMRSDDLGFRLLGHFWTEERFLQPMHDELAAAIAAEKSGEEQ